MPYQALETLEKARLIAQCPVAILNDQAGPAFVSETIPCSCGVQPDSLAFSLLNLLRSEFVCPLLLWWNGLSSVPLGVCLEVVLLGRGSFFGGANPASLPPPTELVEVPPEQYSSHDYREDDSANYRSEDDGPGPASPVPDYGKYPKSLPPRFQKQHQQVRTPPPPSPRDFSHWPTLIS